MVVEGSSERSLEAMLRAALAVAGFFFGESSSFADPVQCCSATGRPLFIGRAGPFWDRALVLA